LTWLAGGAWTRGPSPQPPRRRLRLRPRASRFILTPLALALPALGAAQSAVSPAYETTLRRYQSGDREGAIADMSAWPERRLRDEMTALRALCEKARACQRCPAADRWEKTPVRAALMLHSDSAQKARRDGQSPVLQESAAAEVAGLMKGDPSHRGFARRWYEAMASLAEAETRWAEALAWAERGLRDFPDSVEMRLVQASIEETQGVLELTQLLHRREVRERFERAHGALLAAIAVDASLHEPRLRLGRVAWRLGEAAEARSVLEDVLARKPEARAAFLAHLFLGRVDEDAGRLDEALGSYEAALALDPRSQSARVALSHLRLRRGDAAGARADVEKAVGSAGRRSQPDAFWLYPWGPSVGVQDRLEALRQEARS
jgi:tetratricopeptide (TPR) repeat protein